MLICAFIFSKLAETCNSPTEAGQHQKFDRLRQSLEGSLLGKDAKKFIENNGSKGWRISTHPDFVVILYF